MVTRRNRVLALLLVVVLGTGILALIPNLKWIIPLHIVLLVVLAAYIALAILMPHAERRH
jgi:heme A synthase